MADRLETLIAELPATNARTSTTKQQVQRMRGARPCGRGETLRIASYFFLANDRTCATTALISSSESFALNEGMYLPLPFLTISPI